MEKLDEQIDLDRKVLRKDPFDKDDNDLPEGSGTTSRMISITDPESGQQT